MLWQKQSRQWVVLPGQPDCVGFPITAVHRWVQSRTVTLLRHALRLSQASGIPIERFVGDEDGQEGEK